jgi:hypothetical protein
MIKRVLLWACLAALLVAAADASVAYVHLKAKTPSHHSRSTVVTTTLPIGPDGPESLAIAAENKLPGTTSWHLPSNNNPTAVQGFAATTYATLGQHVIFYVSSSEPYRAYAYRMGWYQGLGGRLIWSSPKEPSSIQPACPLDSSTNTVSCANWSPSFSMDVTKQFPPGDYLIKFVAGLHAASYDLLTVAQPSSKAAYVVMTPSFVEQGWNTYGGYDFYGGEGPCILDKDPYPVCNRARAVSFDRPYATGSGSSDFLNNDFPLIQLMEKEGLDVTYVTDIEVSEDPALLLEHHALIDLAHDESWTYEERKGVEAATAKGVNVAYFGAAAMVRHVRLEPSPLGSDRIEVDYRNGGEDPALQTLGPLQATANTWADSPTDWPPLSQIGEQYSGYLDGPKVAMTVIDSSSWFYKGTGLSDGDTLPGVITSDFDHAVTSTLTPTTLQILAHSPIPASEATASGELWNGDTYSDVVYFTDPSSKAGVINMGNNVWIGDLQHCTVKTLVCPATAIATMTNNVLRLFGSGPAGVTEPSVPNFASVTPAGS